MESSSRVKAEADERGASPYGLLVLFFAVVAVIAAFVVVELDAGEAPGPFFQRSALIGVVGLSLVAAAAAGIASLWRRRQVKFYQRRFDAQAGFREALEREAADRERVQDALRRSEERFRRVVEQAPEGIIVESGARIEYANPSALETLGVPDRADLLGKSFLDIVISEEREAARERIAAAIGGARLISVERRLVLANGESIPTEISAAPIEYDGRAAALIFFRDISERKRTEAERERLEMQLLQAQKMESVGRLAGGVAHDFNNHLTVINGYSDMLLSGLPPGDPREESLQEIRAAAGRAAALTQQLLAFSRKQITEMKPVSLNDIVAEATRMIRRLIGEDIDMELRLDETGSVVMADRGQLNQVLLNLAVNARDAMPRGGRLSVETRAAELDDSCGGLHPDARPGRYAVLAVEDTGVGMNEEVLQRIFEPFFTTKRTGEGTGLGLATVYGIVRQSHGWVVVASERGKGTRFAVYLPAVEGSIETESAPQPKECAPGGSETILIAEDQAEVRRLAAAILRERGYHVVEAGDGPAALALCADFSAPIDLLLTDVIMPGMTGRELAAALTRSRASLKVLYTSGYAADVISKQGVLDQGVAYLPKPFTAEELAGKVREVLDAKA